MAQIRVTVSVTGEQLDVAALVQEQLEQGLRFRTVGTTCGECLAMEALSDAGGAFTAPPLHPHCDCRLVVVNEEGNEEPI